jgi:integrase/recombinase XerD
MSALGEHLDRYLRVRRALGYRLVEHGRLLRRFVTELDAGGHTTISVDVALAWAATASTDQATARRLSAIRRFARYVATFDPATEVPPANLTRGGPGRQPSTCTPPARWPG